MSALLSYVVHQEVNKVKTSYVCVSKYCFKWLNVHCTLWGAPLLAFSVCGAISNIRSKQISAIPSTKRQISGATLSSWKVDSRVMTPWQHITWWMMTVNSYQPSIRKVWYDIKFFGFSHSAVHWKSDKIFLATISVLAFTLHTPCRWRNQLSQWQLTRLYKNCLLSV